MLGVLHLALHYEYRCKKWQIIPSMKVLELINKFHFGIFHNFCEKRGSPKDYKMEIPSHFLVFDRIYKRFQNVTTLSVGSS